MLGWLLDRAAKSRLPTVAATLSVAGFCAFIIAALLVWFGLYNVAASTKHTPPVQWLLHFVMQRSVAAHAPELPVPDLDDPMLILRGALHYSMGCAACHGAPGQLASPIAQQMTPVPPGLYGAWPFALTVMMSAFFTGLLLQAWWFGGISAAGLLLCTVIWLWPERKLAQRAEPPNV